MMSIVAIIIAVIVVLYLISAYNGLVSFRNRVKEAWSDVQVQMKRRYDLIPNLVETVKGYAAHESGTLEKVIQALHNGFNGETFSDIANYLLTLTPVADPYMCLADFGAFFDIHEKADKVYQNKLDWAKKSINNISSAGIFASDRSIREYAERIWNLKKIK